MILGALLQRTLPLMFEHTVSPVLRRCQDTQSETGSFTVELLRFSNLLGYVMTVPEKEKQNKTKPIALPENS